MVPATLVDMAALAAEEGCVGETLGVLLARDQLARTTDPLVRPAHHAREHPVADEERHAELAWRFVSWAIARGGAPVARAVAAALRRAIDATLAVPIRTQRGVDTAAWRAHGRPTCADARAVAERGIREVLIPCAEALLGAPLPTEHADRSNPSAHGFPPNCRSDNPLHEDPVRLRRRPNAVGTARQWDSRDRIAFASACHPAIAEFLQSLGNRHFVLCGAHRFERKP